MPFCFKRWDSYNCNINDQTSLVLLSFLFSHTNQSTRTRNGVVEVSHIILNNQYNIFAKQESETQKLYVGEGNTNRKLDAGRALAKTEKSIPLFFDPKEKDTCIYYVGHWKPLGSTAKEFNPPQPFLGRNRVMYIELQLDKFDDDLADAIKDR